jgi:DNA-binding beta-propeller fold protein YncE
VRTIDFTGEARAKDGQGRLMDFGDSPVPIGILTDPAGERAYVATANADVVIVVDLETWMPVGKITAGKEPDGMGYSGVEVEGHHDPRGGGF